MSENSDYLLIEKLEHQLSIIRKNSKPTQVSLIQKQRYFQDINDNEGFIQDGIV